MEKIQDEQVMEEVLEPPIVTAEKKKHILELVGNVPGNLNRVAAELLQGRGLPEPSGRSRSKSRRNTTEVKLLIPISQLTTTTLKGSDVIVSVPLVLKESCEFIRNHIDTEGIFRKSGSTTRQQGIMDRFMATERSELQFLPADTVFDVCCAMKQYLREMTEPLIPKELHSIFVSCLGLNGQDAIAESVLLAVFLLPLQNIHILCYIMQFLHEVTKHSHQNQMGSRNLAVVFAPNIMPVEEKKHAKGIQQHYERIALDNHTKVVEILIENGELIGCISDKFESVFSLSEEEDGSRKKRRRSGSLTRVLGGIFWKAKIGRDREPETPDFKTPVSHTPIIMDSKKRQLEFTMSSRRRKKTILDSVRNHGLTGGPGSTTPSSYVTCPSPVVCLNPSPFGINSGASAIMAEKSKRRSPSISEWSNFTPELFGKKRRGRSPPNESASSTNGKLKNKLLFSKKPGKKPATLDDGTPLPGKLEKSAITSSKMSIHRLARSPRAGKLVRVPSKIPIAEPPPYFLKKEPSSSFAVINSNENLNECVTFSNDVSTFQERNDAFISSPTDSFHSGLSKAGTDPSISHENDKFEQTTDFSLSLPNWEMELLQPLATSGKDSESQLPVSTVIQTVEDEFTRIMKESRVVELVSECKLSRKSFQGHSFRADRVAVSPSEKRIRSARRKTHEVKGTASDGLTPRFMSLRSPKSRPDPPPILARSPSRCTLQRGRPNTMRAGLARPSPQPGSDEAIANNLDTSDFPTENLRKVTLDRHGRIGRRNTRPVLPQLKDQFKGITTNQNPLSPANPDPPKPQKLSYMASKLKLGNSGNSTTPGRATRSYSMRDDLLLSTASPIRTFLLARTNKSGIPRYQYPSTEQIQKSTSRPETPPTPSLPLKRILSVQELVRRIENGNNQSENSPPGSRFLTSGKPVRKLSIITSTNPWQTVSDVKPQSGIVRNPSMRKTPALKVNNV